MKDRIHFGSGVFRRLTLASLLGLAAVGTARAQDAVKLTPLDHYVGTDLNNFSSAFTLGRDGNLYGTTDIGGVNAAGSVFKITPDGTLTTLHSFAANDGNLTNLVSPLVEGATGVFYGTSDDDGTSDYGEVFKMTSDGTFTVLHTFDSDDGNLSETPLVVASDGNLYGTTFGGGAYQDGSVYKITPAGDYTLLHSFKSQRRVSAFGRAGAGQ